METKELSYYTYEVGQDGWKPFKGLEWNILVHDFNSNKIVVRNLFDHYGLLNSLYKLKKEEDFNKFGEEVRSQLMYYFWSKAEHEIVITTHPPYISEKEFEKLKNEDVKYRTSVNLECGNKIDVYTQVMLN